MADKPFIFGQESVGSPLTGVLSAGSAARISSALGMRTLGQTVVTEDALFSAEKVQTLSRAVDNARLSAAYSAVSSMQPPEDPTKREAFCWDVLRANAKGRASSLGLGAGLRGILTDILLETMSGTGEPVKLSPTGASNLRALTDSDFIRALVFLRGDLIDQLKIRLAEKGVVYPENPYGTTQDYSLLMQRNLLQIPEVSALVADDSFGLKVDRGYGQDVNTSRLQRLVFEALRLYPGTQAWMMEASGEIGRKSISAFAPGGFDEVGYSILFTVLKGHETIWKSIGPALSHARENYLEFGARTDPLFKFEGSLPWVLLGNLYTNAKPGMPKPVDSFKAFEGYRKVFSEEKPITKDQFYRNVGVLLLRLMEPYYKPEPSLFQDLLSPDFEQDFEPTFHKSFLDVFRERLQRGYVQLTDAQRSSLPAFFAATSDEARMRALGRVFSTEPFAQAFFDPEHKLFLGDVLFPRVKEFFSPKAVDVDTSKGVEFTPADRASIDRLCSVMQLLRENQFSFPYTIVERLYGVGHSSQHLSVGPEVVEILRALPPEGVEPFSPVSLAVHMLRQYVENSGGSEKDSSLVEFTKSVLQMASSSMGSNGLPDREREVATDSLFRDLMSATTLREVLALAQTYKDTALPVMTRDAFNSYLLDSGFQPVAPTEMPFGYSAGDHEQLAKVLEYPIGLSFLDRRMDPDPFTVIRAGAYFEQQGQAPDAFWSFHLDALKELVASNPLPVFQPGKKFNQDSKLVTPDLLNQGYLEAFAFVQGVTRDEVPPLGTGSVSLEVLGGGRLNWEDPKVWESGARGLDLLEKQVKFSLGRSAKLDDVSGFLRLAASYKPQHADFFLSGASISEQFLKASVYDRSVQAPETAMEHIREKLGHLGMEKASPVYNQRSALVQPSL